MFELSMPGRGSWNGSWAGEKKRYVKFRSLRNDEQDNIEESSYHYDFGDGWRANVEVKIVDYDKKKRLKKVSSGFCNYDWMIDSIIQNGEIIS